MLSDIEGVIQPGRAIVNPEQFGKRHDAGSGYGMKHIVLAKQIVRNDSVDVRTPFGAVSLGLKVLAEPNMLPAYHGLF